MYHFEEAKDYKQRNNWSIDRMKFEIEELDKIYPFLTEKYKELEARIDYYYNLINEANFSENFHEIAELRINAENIRDEMDKCQNQIWQNWEKREELVKILRSKLTP
ncbi:hypothetical protein H6G81_15340 [Scytonema hofmannii FACHB-248]|jgi:uncharacterized coiled-coil DUF342 family protein|uniref:Uncharacterized protein n=1 Tax=Scytonema hofmannii FACHB-248 TaxID=1842502 RepID=A0ABR8GQY5_9CYAN|nr:MULTISPECIES: hypothetical protein [Nostocales]MBD2605854.1 hypothetical protein [Scytonema hofmannii FACHB-248]